MQCRMDFFDTLHSKDISSFQLEFCILREIHLLPFFSLAEIVFFNLKLSFHFEFSFCIQEVAFYLKFVFTWREHQWIPLIHCIPIRIFPFYGKLIFFHFSLSRKWFFIWNLVFFLIQLLSLSPGNRFLSEICFHLFSGILHTLFPPLPRALGKI